MAKSKNIIYKLVANVHHPIFEEKIAQKMWNPLEI